MTYVIVEPCIGTKNASCVDVCPVSCIYEAEDMYYINPDECIECGACEPECPVTAIFHDSAVPDEWSEYTQLNADWFVDKEAVRQLVRRFTVSRPNQQSDVCYGTLLSREQYLHDLQSWKYRDGREQPEGPMSKEEIDIWTRAIKEVGSR